MSVTLFSKQPLALRKTIIAIVLAIVCMLFDFKHPAWFANLRSTTHAAMQPVYRFSAYPSFVTHWLLGNVRSKESLRRENSQLEAELAQANVRLQQLDYLAAQNARLQGVLSAPTPLSGKLTLARVIGIDSNPLKHVLVLDKGGNNGVYIGQTVVDEKGIMGQIINVYPVTSRVLLISDTQQSVAVQVKRTGQRAIVTGTGDSNNISLQYIPKTADIQVGDELISSGLGERVPAGFNIGKVAKIDREHNGDFAKIDVQTTANLTNSAYVLLLNHKHSTPTLGTQQTAPPKQHPINSTHKLSLYDTTHTTIANTVQ